jgi:hypothetical protein
LRGLALCQPAEGVQIAVDILLSTAIWIEKDRVVREEVSALAGFGIDRARENKVGLFDHGVTPIDLLDIGHDALRAVVSERADHEHQQCWDQREDPALCQPWEAKSQAG